MVSLPWSLSQEPCRCAKVLLCNNSRVIILSHSSSPLAPSWPSWIVWTSYLSCPTLSNMLFNFFWKLEAFSRQVACLVHQQQRSNHSVLKLLPTILDFPWRPSFCTWTCLSCSSFNTVFHCLDSCILAESFCPTAKDEQLFVSQLFTISSFLAPLRVDTCGGSFQLVSTFFEWFPSSITFDKMKILLWHVICGAIPGELFGHTEGPWWIEKVFYCCNQFHVQFKFSWTEFENKLRAEIIAANWSVNSCWVGSE